MRVVIFAAFAAACGSTTRGTDVQSRTGEEPCTKARLVLEPPTRGGRGRAEIDVSPRPGRERVEYVGRRLEVRDVTGALMLAIDKGMDPEAEPLPTVMQWSRASLPRVDLLLRYETRVRPPSRREGCEVRETRLVVYRDLQPGSGPALEEVLEREAGCGAPELRAAVRICGDGNVVRIKRRRTIAGRERLRRLERRYEDVSKRFGPLTKARTP